MGSRGTDIIQLAVFDKPYKYKWDEKLKDFFVPPVPKSRSIPLSGGGRVHMRRPRKKHTSASAHFITDDGRRGAVDFTHNVMNSIVSLAFDIDGSIGVTGKGDAFRIFATVLSCVREVMDNDVHQIIRKYVFSAEKSKEISSKARLYSRLIDKFIDDNEWKTVAKDDPIEEEVRFSLTRKSK